MTNLIWKSLCGCRCPAAMLPQVISNHNTMSSQLSLVLGSLIWQVTLIAWHKIFIREPYFCPMICVVYVGFDGFFNWLNWFNWVACILHWVNEMMIVTFPRGQSVREQHFQLYHLYHQHTHPNFILTHWFLCTLDFDLSLGFVNSWFPM